MPNTGNRPQKPKHSPITQAKNSSKPSFRKRSASAPVWDEIPSELLHTLVCACTTHNAPPTFSYTRDGTALVMSIYYDGERYVDYLADEGEFIEYLSWVLRELLKLSDEDANYYLQARL